MGGGAIIFASVAAMLGTMSAAIIVMQSDDYATESTDRLRLSDELSLDIRRAEGAIQWGDWTDYESFQHWVQRAYCLKNMDCWKPDVQKLVFTEGLHA